MVKRLSRSNSASLQAFRRIRAGDQGVDCRPRTPLASLRCRENKSILVNSTSDGFSSSRQLRELVRSHQSKYPQQIRPETSASGLLGRPKPPTKKREEPKQCEVRDEVFHGAPNFVLDVFYSEDDPDFLRRRDRFCNFGVQEYLVAFDAESGGRALASIGRGLLPVSRAR